MDEIQLELDRIQKGLCAYINKRLGKRTKITRQMQRSLRIWTQLYFKRIVKRQAARDRRRIKTMRFDAFPITVTIKQGVEK